MTDDNGMTVQQLVLKDLSDTSVLPVVSTGALSGCFLVNAVDVTIYFPRLPKIVQDTWAWQGDATEATLNNLWVAVEVSWVKARMADRGIKMTDALADLITLCGLSSVGEKKGLKKSMLRLVKKRTFTLCDMLHHNGSGFEAGDHPAVLVIKRQGKTDKPLLSIVGDPNQATVFHLDAAPDPLANVVAFPKKD